MSVLSLDFKPDFNPNLGLWSIIGDGVERAAHHLIIDGIKVFEFSINEVAKNINALEENYKIKMTESANYFVMHQANLLINETIRKQLKIPKEKTLYSIENFGNTSAASIPLSMAVNLSSATTHNKNNFLLTGFGAGLSWASAYIENANLFCLPLFEIDNLTALEH